MPKSTSRSARSISQWSPPTVYKWLASFLETTPNDTVLVAPTCTDGDRANTAGLFSGITLSNPAQNVADHFVIDSALGTMSLIQELHCSLKWYGWWNNFSTSNHWCSSWEWQLLHVHKQYYGNIFLQFLSNTHCTNWICGWSSYSHRCRYWRYYWDNLAII